MFGRRKHAATAVPVEPVPQLTDSQVLDIVHRTVSDLIGETGEWTVSRRTAEDTDTIFHTVLAKSVSVGITLALAEARRSLPRTAEEATAADEATPAEKTTAAPPSLTTEPEPETPSIDAVEVTEQPAAMTWEPAPLTVWADLRKPITGEIPTVAADASRHAA